MKAGVDFEYLPQAQAAHRDMPTIRRVLDHARLEGAAEVQLLRLHPDLYPSTEIARILEEVEPIDWLAENLPKGAASIPRLLEGCLPTLERVGLRKPWRSCCLALKRYWYLRGACEQCPDYAGWRSSLIEQPQIEPEAPYPLELARGLQSAEAELDVRAPASVQLMFRSQPVTTIPALPAAERLRGRHLRSFLRQAGGHELLLGLAWERLAHPTDLHRSELAE
jgi:hypothetical protein